MEFKVTDLRGRGAAALCCTGATYGATIRIVGTETVEVAARRAIGAETVTVVAAAKVAAWRSWLNCDSPLTIE